MNVSSLSSQFNQTAGYIDRKEFMPLSMVFFRYGLSSTCKLFMHNFIQEFIILYIHKTFLESENDSCNLLKYLKEKEKKIQYTLYY